MKQVDKSMIGKQVVFTDAKAHKEEPWFYPPVGSIGTIISVGDPDEEDWAVQWSENSGVDRLGVDGFYTWYCYKEGIELVETTRTLRNSDEMTDEEIWKMLEPKMTKNGFTTKMSYIQTSPTSLPEEDPIIKTYDADMVHEMVALAYKVGYMRAKKGRSFEYQKKNKEEKNIED